MAIILQNSTCNQWCGEPTEKRCFSFTLDGTEESRCRSVQGIGPVSTGTTATAHLRFRQIRQVQQVAEVDANSDDSGTGHGCLHIEHELNHSESA